MHIPDGFLSTPVWATMNVLSAAGIGYAVRKTKAEMGEEKIPLLGTLAAFVFAAQMLNFPVLAGTSGHLLGSFLIAKLIGPWPAFLAMSAIFIVQSLIFQDGGLLALGANIFNMGFIGSVLCFYIYKLLINFSNKNFYDKLMIFFCALLAVFLGAIFTSLELSLSGTVPLKESLIAMGGIHALIGIFEGIITVLVVAFAEKILIKTVKVREVSK